MLIDTHCHLNFEAFKADLPQVIERAKERGVEKIIIPGTDLASSEAAISIAQSYSNCWAAVGIHPHHTKDTNLIVDDTLKNKLKKLLSQNRVVAAGEIGLDYYVYTKSKYHNTDVTPQLKQKQLELFLMQYRLSVEFRLPVIFHCRSAYKDMIQTISSEANIVKINSRNRETTLPSPGVFHCFGGSKKDLSLLISMGYYIGFDGNITYSPDWGQFVSSTPLSQLLLETDSPYLTPVPYRGERNEPHHLTLVAETVAKYHGVSPVEVAEKTTQNAKKLFKLT